MKNGFTLIELLVVVLIIGVLAAIALPQYQLAALKARAAGMIQTLDGLRRAEEIHYMTNGYYIANSSVLDYDYQGACAGTDVIRCDDLFYVDILGGSGIVTNPGGLYLAGYYCPGLDWTPCYSSDYDFVYSVWLDHSAKPGVRECVGRSEMGKRFCKTMQD